MTDEDCKRHEVTYQEARTVLEAQVEVMSKIDTKAVRTVRITVLFVGIVASAWKLRPTLFDSAILLTSSLALVGALATGLFTYSESDLFLGPSEAYIGQLVDDEFEDCTWKHDLLYTLGGWIDENDEKIRFDGRLLFVTQTFLFVGVALLALSVLL